MVGRVAPLLALALLVSGCGDVTRVVASSPTAAVAVTPRLTTAPSASPTAVPAPTARPEPCRVDAACAPIASALAAIDASKMNDHLIALTNVGSRDPRNPGHAKAVAYIKEQLSANAYSGWKIESQRTVYQGIPLENIFATIDLRPVAD